MITTGLRVTQYSVLLCGCMTVECFCAFYILSIVRNLMLPTTFLFSRWMHIQFLKQTLPFYLILIVLSRNGFVKKRGRKIVWNSFKLVVYKYCTMLYFRLFEISIYFCGFSATNKTSNQGQKNICLLLFLPRGVERCKAVQNT